MANVRFMKCYPQHLVWIVAQDIQRKEQLDLLNGIDQSLQASQIAESAWIAERCIGAAGLTEFHRGRALAWALLSSEGTRHMLPIVRRMRRMVDTYPVKRVEMVVLADFVQGHRLAQLLGFKCETPEPMEGYFPDGSAGVQYAKVKLCLSHSQSLAA